MLDLHKNAFQNELQGEEREVWFPALIFYNTEDKTESSVDEKTYWVAARESSYRRRNHSHLHNAYVYRGGENPFYLSKVHSVTFLCDYNMARYPFDTQSCAVLMKLKHSEINFARLRATKVTYRGPADLPQYVVLATDMREVTISIGIPAAAVRADIYFGRRILSTVLSSYLPTLFICIMSCATNYFKPHYFEAIVTVNLTSLLALTTLFVSVLNSLPLTSYIKMIDVWFIFCLTIPFFEVILQVTKGNFFPKKFQTVVQGAFFCRPRLNTFVPAKMGNLERRPRRVGPATTGCGRRAPS